MLSLFSEKSIYETYTAHDEVAIYSLDTRIQYWVDDI